MPRSRFSGLVAEKPHTETINTIRVSAANLKIVFIEISIFKICFQRSSTRIGYSDWLFASSNRPLVIHDVHQERRSAIRSARNRFTNRKMGVVRPPVVSARYTRLVLVG